MQRSIIAEWYKIKNTPIVWLVFLGGFLTVFVVSLIYIINVAGAVDLDTNPWDSFINRSFAANSIFIMTPFIILLTSYISYLEIQSNGWKFLYTLPRKRAEIYLSKLFVVVLLLILALVFYFFACLLAGYLVDFIYPEYEFRYYQPDLSLFLENIFKLFLSLLGIIGFQYWLSILSKNFILPIGIGLIAFFAGFVLFTSSSEYGQYYPFAFPMLVRKFKMVSDSGDHVSSFYQVSGVISILVFVGFAILGVIQNGTKNIK